MTEKVDTYAEGVRAQARQKHEARRVKAAELTVELVKLAGEYVENNADLDEPGVVPGAMELATAMSQAMPSLARGTSITQWVDLAEILCEFSEAWRTQR